MGLSTIENSSLVLIVIISFIIIFYLILSIVCEMKSCRWLGFYCRKTLCKIKKNMPVCKEYTFFEELNWFKSIEHDFLKSKKNSIIVSIINKLAYPKAKKDRSLFIVPFFASIFLAIVTIVFFIDTPGENHTSDILKALLIIPLIQLVLKNNDEINNFFIGAFSSDDVREQNYIKKNNFMDDIYKTFTKTIQLYPKDKELWEKFCLIEQRDKLKYNVEQAVELRLALIKSRYSVSGAVLESIYILLGIIFYFFKLYNISLFFLFAALYFMAYSIIINIRSLLKLYFLKRLCIHLSRQMEECNKNTDKPIIPRQ